MMMTIIQIGRNALSTVTLIIASSAILRSFALMGNYEKSFEKVVTLRGRLAVSGARQSSAGGDDRCANQGGAIWKILYPYGAHEWISGISLKRLVHGQEQERNP